MFLVWRLRLFVLYGQVTRLVSERSASGSRRGDSPRESRKRRPGEGDDVPRPLRDRRQVVRRPWRRPLEITRRAGHASFSTTEGYIREAENLRDGFGEVFGPPPPRRCFPRPSRATAEFRLSGASPTSCRHEKISYFRRRRRESNPHEWHFINRRCRSFFVGRVRRSLEFQTPVSSPPVPRIPARRPSSWRRFWRRPPIHYSARTRALRLPQGSPPTDHRLSSRVGSSGSPRSCPPRTLRGAWPAPSRWHWR